MIIKALRSAAVLRSAIFWSLLLSGSSLWAQPDQDAPIDAGFNFTLTTDVPYVEQKLDQTTSLQTMDIYAPNDVENAPVILYLHGGGWAFGDKKDVHVKPNYFTLHNMAFVSMNYRLRWDYKVYDQLVDVVSALAWLRDNGAEYGLDANRVILMGHAAGGHLASLIVSDSSYLRAEGMDGRQIKAVVSIDSTSYDIVRLMKELGSFVERQQHELIFSSDEGVWKAASPVTHVSKSRNLPPFALLYNPEREVTTLQAKGFAKALAAAGVETIMIPGSKTEPSRTDELIGISGNVATGALMAFIRSQI